MRLAFQREEFGTKNIDAVGRVPVTPHAEIVTAPVTIHIVIKDS
jgi:hypothetical protein